MKILIVSGFLGAGKTTFIKTMSEKTGYDFCVYENEYGQSDIDKTLLSKDTNLSIWELTENCICCTGKQDFATTILTIANTIDPEYLIVEPTGVAKLSSIVQNIKKIEYEHISLLEPITIIDGNSIDRYKKEYADIYLDQIQTSNHIVLSKMEKSDSENYAMVTKKINEINPSAKVLENHYCEQNSSWWNEILHTSISGEKIVNTQSIEESNLENITLLGVSMDSPTHLIAFLEMVTFGIFGDVCRGKGYLPCGGQWLKFDVVDSTYSITGIEEQREAQVVFIGKKLYRAGYREILNPRYFPKIVFNKK